MGQETCHIAKQIHQISARPLEALDHSLPVLTENNAQPKTSELFLISGQNWELKALEAVSQIALRSKKGAKIHNIFLQQIWSN